MQVKHILSRGRLQLPMCLRQGWRRFQSRVNLGSERRSQGQGLVGIGAEQLFSPGELAASNDFSQVYNQDRVHIFALEPDACGTGSQ